MSTPRIGRFGRTQVSMVLALALESQFRCEACFRRPLRLLAWRILVERRGWFRLVILSMAHSPSHFRCETFFHRLRRNLAWETSKKRRRKQMRIDNIFVALLRLLPSQAVSDATMLLRWTHQQVALSLPCHVLPVQTPAMGMNFPPHQAPRVPAYVYWAANIRNYYLARKRQEAAERVHLTTYLSFNLPWTLRRPKTWNDQDSDAVLEISTMERSWIIST